VNQEHAEEGAEEEPGQIADAAGDAHLVANRADHEIGCEQEKIVEGRQQHGPDLVFFDRNDSLQKTRHLELGLMN
jgi:hypothetical protein